MTGRPQHPAAELADHTALFGQRHEVLRQHDASFGVPPADQRLDPGHLAAPQAEDRLVDERQLVVFDCPLQVDLEVEALDYRRVHPGLEDRVAALATALGPVHGQVGVSQQGLGLLGPGGDPDTGADEELALAQLERWLQRSEQPLRGPCGVAGLAQLLEEHGEFVAPQAGDRVRRAQGVREPLGDRDQETVAGAVPEAVVDGLEAVEIAEQHGDRGAGSLGAGD